MDLLTRSRLLPVLLIALLGAVARAQLPPRGHSGEPDSLSGTEPLSERPSEWESPFRFENAVTSPAGYQAPDNLELPRPTPLERQPRPRKVRQSVFRPGSGGDPEGGSGSPPWVVPASGTFSTTVLPGSGDSFGITELDTRLTLLSPRKPQFQVSPGATVTFLDGPNRTDLPAELYNVRVDFSYMTPINEKWALNVGISPGLFTDFEQTDSDSLRIIGRALAFYQHDEKAQYVFGVVYLDRENIAAVPAIGMIYSPTTDSRVELTFPRPRFAYRLKRDWRPDANPQMDGLWGYVGGEFGGGSWSIDRLNGTRDIVTYNDFRLVLGLELKKGRSRPFFVEGAWVFGRDIEYDSGLGDFAPDDTAMIRIGAGF